ncbi:hypothetical protein RF11_07884 [Thelohanellus kitauei]|uniref:MD-2-related lipid-recognition domain-containing protein n=1 Tax=Thelohanellus kitauei TaxID=669202 RepID=A0A0C2ICY8_THEKT|nr:hypothetical protein RF11_07884 [Thelohanellus kitauei]
MMWMNVNFFVVITVVCSTWKISHCQLYLCTLRVDKLSYVTKSAFLTDCTKDKCLRKPGQVRTLKMTFTPLVFSQTAKMTVEDHMWGSLGAGTKYIDVDLCSEGYIECPVFPNATYTIEYSLNNVSLYEPEDHNFYEAWTSFKIANEEDTIIGCVKSLASPEGVDPKRHRS